MWEPGGESGTGRDAAKTHFALICGSAGHTTPPRPTPQLQQLPCIVGKSWQPTQEPNSHILSSVESLKHGKVHRIMQRLQRFQKTCQIFTFYQNLLNLSKNLQHSEKFLSLQGQDLALSFFNNVAQGRNSGGTGQGDNHQYGCVVYQGGGTLINYRPLFCG